MAKLTQNRVTDIDDRMWHILAIVNARMNAKFALDTANIEANCSCDHAKAHTFVRPRYPDTSEVYFWVQSFLAWKLVAQQARPLFLQEKSAKPFESLQVT